MTKKMLPNTKHKGEFWNYDVSLYVRIICEPFSFGVKKIKGKLHYVVPIDKQIGLHMKRISRKELDTMFED